MEEKEKKSAAEHSRQKVQKRTLIYILVAIGFAVAVVLSFALRPVEYHFRLGGIRSLSGRLRKMHHFLCKCW